MPTQKRNFWILLTVAGLLFSLYAYMQPYWQAQFYNNTSHYSCASIYTASHAACPVSPPSYTPSIDEFVDVDRLPYPTNKVEIERNIERLYPRTPSCVMLRGEKVVIRVLIDEKGHYKAHKVIKSTNSFYTHLYENSIESMKFRPAIRDGRPIEYWLNVEFE